MCLKKKIDYHQNHKICRVNLLCNNILYFALFAIDFFCRFGYNSLRQFAGVMELADVLDSKSSGSDTVPVRPRSPAPNFHGLVAQLGERCVRNAEVKGSNPSRSTILCKSEFNLLREALFRVCFYFEGADPSASSFFGVSGIAWRGCPSLMFAF